MHLAIPCCCLASPRYALTDDLRRLPTLARGIASPRLRLMRLGVVARLALLPLPDTGVSAAPVQCDIAHQLFLPYLTLLCWLWSPTQFSARRPNEPDKQILLHGRCIQPSSFHRRCNHARPVIVDQCTSAFFVPAMERYFPLSPTCLAGAACLATTYAMHSPSLVIAIPRAQTKQCNPFAALLQPLFDLRSLFVTKAFSPPCWILRADTPCSLDRPSSNFSGSERPAAASPSPAPLHISRIPHALALKCLPCVRRCDRYSSAIPGIALVTFPPTSLPAVSIVPCKVSHVAPSFPAPNPLPLDDITSTMARLPLQALILRRCSPNWKDQPTVNATGLLDSLKDADQSFGASGIPIIPLLSSCSILNLPLPPL